MRHDVTVRARDLLWPIFRPMVSGHVAMYRATGGRLGHRFPGFPPMLLLEHVGARTGTKRTTALSYIPDGDRIVIVASKGGHPSHPAWFHNLRANPDTTIQVGTDHRPVRARVATDEERTALWPKVVRAYRGYASYQRHTDREIPLMILERREASTPAR
jgi:deazaflavin-dependent oxidoreductase (nitroreductase family)